MAQQVLNYIEQGGARSVIGGEIDVVSGGSLKIAGTAIAATAEELNRAADVSARIVTLTAATLAITELLHDGKTVTINKIDGTTITLPAATGSGLRVRFFVLATITSVGAIIKVANASDTMVGGAIVLQDGGDTMVGFEAVGTADTITLNGTTTGGIKGDEIIVEDVATNLWKVWAMLSATGVEATPFSATV